MSDDEKLKALREAWLDTPFDAVVPVGCGQWLQPLINAVSAIVDPDRALRETPEAMRRGRLASHRSKFAHANDQASIADRLGLADERDGWQAKAIATAAECFGEFGEAL